MALPCQSLLFGREVQRSRQPNHSFEILDSSDKYQRHQPREGDGQSPERGRCAVATKCFRLSSVLCILRSGKIPFLYKTVI